MKIKDELKEIKNKDLSTMSEKELKEYKEYVLNYRNNAETRTKAKKMKVLYNVLGTGMALGSMFFLFKGISAIIDSFTFAPVILNIGLVCALDVAVYVFKHIYKHAERNKDEIKQVCTEKLSDISLQEIKNAEKKASKESVVDEHKQVFEKVEEQEVVNTQKDIDIHKSADEGISR